jgi:hypothetical protein
MTLTLSTRPDTQPHERLVVPACLQPRAPLRYEIRDEDDRRVWPTLAGYKLRRGKTYRLIVQTQDRGAQGWNLRLLAPRSTAEAAGPDQIDGEGRALIFHTAAPISGERWQWFGSAVTALPVYLDFADGRAPYQLSIPVILRASRFRWIGSLLLTALGSIAADAVFRERFAIPSPTHIAYIAGLWVAVLLACLCWDQWKFYKRALQLMHDRDLVQRSSPVSSPHET